MSERSPIQFRSDKPPLREMLVQQRLEPIAMGAVDEVQEFVDDQVFQALGWLLRQPSVQRFPIPPGFRRADPNQRGLGSC